MGSLLCFITLRVSILSVSGRAGMGLSFALEKARLCKAGIDVDVCMTDLDLTGLAPPADEAG